MSISVTFTNYILDKLIAVGDKFGNKAEYLTVGLDSADWTEIEDYPFKVTDSNFFCS